MLTRLADLCAVGLIHQNHLTSAKLAFVTEEPYLLGRLVTINCDGAHPHLSAAG